MNEQDYYGALSAVDTEIGKIRRLLKELNLYENTLVMITSDNGPEVDNTAGHGTANFTSPGSSGGLTGRKRALTEGGFRVPGVVEFPRLIKENKVNS